MLLRGPPTRPARGARDLSPGSTEGRAAGAGGRWAGPPPRTGGSGAARPRPATGAGRCGRDCRAGSGAIEFEVDTSAAPPVEVEELRRQEDGAFGEYEVSCSREVPAEDLLGLVEQVGWPARDPERTARALRGSRIVCSAYQGPQGGGAEGERLVAFARATSDGVLNGVIWDVAVHPEHQGKGLGRKVVSEVLKRLIRSGVTIIGLYAEQKSVPFYAELGFEADVDGVRGMFYWPKALRKR